MNRDLYIPAKPIGIVSAIGSLWSDIFCFIAAVTKKGNAYEQTYDHVAELLGISKDTYRRAVVGMEKAGLLKVERSKGCKIAISIPDGVTMESIIENKVEPIAKCNDHLLQNAMGSDGKLQSPLLQNAMGTPIYKKNIKENKKENTPVRMREYLDGNIPSTDIDLQNAFVEQWSKSYLSATGCDYIPNFATFTDSASQMTRLLVSMMRNDNVTPTQDSLKAYAGDFVSKAWATADKFDREHFDLPYIIKNINKFIQKINYGQANCTNPTTGSKSGGLSTSLLEKAAQILASNSRYVLDGQED